MVSRCWHCSQLCRCSDARMLVAGEDGETESSSDEDEVSEAESIDADSDADERGAPSVIADTIGSLEVPMTQVSKAMLCSIKMNITSAVFQPCFHLPIELNVSCALGHATASTYISRSLRCLQCSCPFCLRGHCSCMGFALA